MSVFLFFRGFCGVVRAGYAAVQPDGDGQVVGAVKGEYFAFAAYAFAEGVVEGFFRFPAREGGGAAAKQAVVVVGEDAQGAGVRFTVEVADEEDARVGRQGVSDVAQLAVLVYFAEA